MSKNNINSLQYGRALAALAVVAHHSCLATTAFVERPPYVVEAFLSRGYLGVDFFFVLSGFIIMHAHMNDARTGQAAAKYIKKRLRRIYIPYLPVSFCIILLYLLVPSASLGNRDWGILTSITLFPTDRPPALSVAWSLIYEIMFYAIFIASYFTKRFIIFVSAWVVAIFGAWSIGWTPEFPVLRIFLSPQNLEFVAGMASAYAYTRVSVRWSPALIGAGVASIAAYFLKAEPNYVWFGISLAPIVIGVALLERLKSPAPLGWLLMLGNASYAIYLVHNPIISIAVRLSMGLHSWMLSLMLCVFAGTAFGVAYHFLVERPGIRMTTNLAWGRSRPTLATPSV
jgi:exopolysaccharide production protein ExoZ